METVLDLTLQLLALYRHQILRCWVLFNTIIIIITEKNVDFTSIAGEDVVASCVITDEVTDTCCSVTVPGGNQRCNTMNV